MWRGVYRWWGGAFSFLVIFLIHRLVLIPHLFLKHRISIYTIAAIFILTLFGITQHFIIDSRRPKPHHEVVMPPKRPYPRIPLMVNCGLAMLMFGFNLSLTLMFKNQREKSMREELERLRLDDELKYLRAQVNPHFFMNMLNNIHALVDIDPEKAKKVIIGLSRLMRHSIYEAEESGASLASEISFISNYVSLMRVRYPEDLVKINLELPSNVPSELRIPPLLYMPLLENAFKHGVSYINETEIDIKVTVEPGQVNFTCRNTKPAMAPHIIRGGLGLMNVRRRLLLLYGSDGYLDIDEEKDSYSVSLIIPTT